MKKTINDNIIDFIIKTSNKIILIYFWSEWCMPCKIFNKIIDEVIKNFKKNIKIIKINSNLNYYSSEKFSIKITPTIIIIKNKSIVSKKQGLINKNYLKKILNDII